MILTSKAKIAEILNDESVSFGFYGDSVPEIPIADNVFYLYSSGCLFPSVRHGEILSIHAAIPEKYRGARAVVSAKKVVAWALENLKVDRVVARIVKRRKNVSVFAVQCGFRYSHDCDEYQYYEVMNG